MKAQRGETGSTRSSLAGAALLLLGGCIGLVLGALLDAPRILMRRLQEPVQTVQLEPDSEPRAVAAAPPAEQLAEYRALQRAEEQGTSQRWLARFDQRRHLLCRGTHSSTRHQCPR